MVLHHPERTARPARISLPAPLPPRPGAGARAAEATRRNLPGLLLAVAGVALADVVHRLVPAVPMLTAAVVLGVVAAHLPLVNTFVRGSARPGLTTAGKRLMRMGIVLLGLKLSLGDVIGLGWESLVMVLGVVLATFFGTQWLGRRVGLSEDQSLFVATGYAICGASAIGAVSGVLGKGESDERRDSEIASSIALVTLCGTLAIAVLPLLQGPLGLNAVEFGRWVGAGVHDVGQVVATAQTAGSDALTEGVLVKLIRVAMLAPLVAGVALSRRRSGDQPAGGRKPALLPLFVAGFLAMVALRSTGLVGAGVLDIADTAQELLLAAALFGLGSAVHLPTLSRSGGKLAFVGLASWVLVAGASYVGVMLTV
ncbi:putative sulfate exporter family transporter [Streptomyces sp. A7024]|uniref:Putative sulfate exporter family transporter n=1 Tax=Streptomyces coryli TaxID=1128680 RepID=A0A6G4UEN4_9ACTN|nr:putative sulfate exporter family transporter [Streptomyces coryli]NGN69881.1 putative sulfate exporter family transporter [Streptomyces coryli]